MNKSKNSVDKPIRKRLSLEQKNEIIIIKDKGAKTKELAKKFGIPKSSVSTIIIFKSRENVKKALLENINPKAVSLDVLKKSPSLMMLIL